MVNRLPLAAPDRLYFSELHSLAVDRKGNEVLCGLSLEESLEYLSITRQHLKQFPECKARHRYLHDKSKAIAIALSRAAEAAWRTGRPN
jgi:hypothetical protein